MAERCKHGMDPRFCSLCSGSARIAGAARTAGSPPFDVNDILAFLNDRKIRATYGAVAALVGVNMQSLAAQLQDRRTEASWVVNASSGLPTGYGVDQMHPALLDNPEIIRTATELQLRFALWKAASR